MENKDPLTHQIIGMAMEVHRELGPGLLESAYEACLCHELWLAGISFQKQRDMPVVYKGLELDCGYRLDILLPGRLVVELKTVDALLPVHEAQLLTYLRLSGIEKGLLINFKVALLKDGIKRMVWTKRN
jgi:GxxExxY protein